MGHPAATLSDLKRVMRQGLTVRPPVSVPGQRDVLTMTTRQLVAGMEWRVDHLGSVWVGRHDGVHLVMRGVVDGTDLELRITMLAPSPSLRRIGCWALFLHRY